jgi:hypothetical protein
LVGVPGTDVVVLAVEGNDGLAGGLVAAEGGSGFAHLRCVLTKETIR